MITLSHVFKRYPGGRQALNDVGFSIDAGELVFRQQAAFGPAANSCKSCHDSFRNR